MIQPTFWPAHSPEVISLAEDEVPLGEERGADLAEAAVAAAALEAVLVPVHVQGLQQVPEHREEDRVSVELLCFVTRYFAGRVLTCPVSSFRSRRTPAGRPSFAFRSSPTWSFCCNGRKRAVLN